ncbi:cadherin-like domain-containing protein [Comamonas suwonensis]|uniref:DUF4347 domain-containing protein n=1 Tax=Comamonas suwonensis TaxID=2606214 RepID=A0A843BCC9_9BURK|nr:cadherin-like domain-containing protein [Comamonas suwonensis]MBI1626910.1 DUF4347 domain-containing protein [Comamonas suwonensis]
MLHPASKLAAMLRPRSHRFALESRQLFDGAALVEAAHATDAPDAAHAAPAHAEAPHPAAAETHPAAKAVADAPAAAAASEAPAAAATPHAVYVMDQSVVDWQQVVQALPTGSEVILIDNRSDGVAQLAAALHGRTDISALQIVSHGASGQITLGDSVITADNIAEHAAQWAAIGASLTADGDILLYGCDVAGQSDALLVRMSALTGADVAASADATGAAVKGGNWTLERSVGQVEAQVLNDVDYQGLLAAPTVTSAATKLSVSENSTLNAPGADQATLSGWNITNGGVGNVTVVVQVDGDANGAPDLVVGGLTVGNAGAPAGTLSFTGTAAQATAWVNSLVFKATDVELGNTEARAVIQVRVTDAATSLVATRTLAVTVTSSNDPVTLSSTPQAVGEGADTPLTVATLIALDPEVDVALTQQPSQIVYGVTANPQYGYLTLNGVRLGIGSVFTQQDVIDGDVHYVHTATGATQNQPDSFGVRANDGATPVAASAAATIALTIAPVNQAPTVSGLGVVLEGQPGNAVDGTGAPLSQVGNFIVADGGGDDASSALTVRITGLPTDGTLYFTGTALVNGTSVNYTVPHAITAAELATGSGFVIAYEARAGLTYGNNGTRDNTGAGTYPFVDGFKVIVSDAGGGTGTPGSTVETNIAITVRPVNDDPTYTGALAPEATVTATGNSTGSYTGPYAVTLTPAMLNATDVDSVDGQLTFAVTSQSGLNQGTLLLNGKLLPVGGVFTVDDVINGRVQYVQTQGAAAGDTDTFQFQVIDNTIGVRWNADGTSITRVGGVYDNLGDPNRVSDDRLHTFDFTVRLAPTAAGNATGFLPNVNTAVESSSTHAGTDTASSTRGVLDEDGSVVIAGAPSGTDPYLSYVVDGVPPSQVVYTILGLTDGGADWNGAIQRQVSGGWVDLNVYDTFTQADLNAGNIRYKHDGTSEDFQSTVRLSASAGVLVDSNGTLMPDNWDTTFTFYVTPTNDAPAVVGSSNAVVAENGTIGITSGMLQISDPDDATSETRLEGTAQNGTGSPALPNGGGDNFAYNNDATGANALRFRVTSLPPGGTLEYLSGGTWVTLTAGTLIDASLLTNSAGSTGLRFVSDGSEVRSTSFNVEAVDRWNQSSNTATVRIQITNVNDAPQIAATPNLPDPAGSVNNPLTGVTEGSAAQITPGMLSAFDPDSSKSQVQYTVTRAPAHGSVALSTDGGTTFKLLGVGSSFTQADVEAGLVYYVNNGDEGDGKTPGSDPPSDSFGFSLGDGDKEQPGNQFWIHTVPANDVATVTAPASADVLGSGTTPVPITGIVVADTDIDVLVQGEEDFLRVEVSVVDPSNNVVGDARINFTAAAPTSARSLVSGAGSNTLVLQGTRAEVNAALASLTLAFNADKDSTDLRLRTTVDDRLYTAGGVLATGANGGASATTNDDGTLINATNNRASAFTALTVSNVNDVPTLGGATVITVTEDTPLALSNLGFVIADADSFGRDVTVTVQLYSDSNRTALANSATEGAFLLGTTAGLTSATGNNSNTITLTGSIAEVQAALDAIRIASATDFNNGPLYMRTTVSDFAHADGGKQAVTDTTVNLLAVNDAPTLTVPTDKVLAAGTSIALPGFVIGDARDLSQGAVDYVEVTVGATLPGGGPAGTLTVVDSGLATTDNNGSATIVVKGTFADVQATLNSMVFAPTAGNADARVQISTLVDDKSNGAETNPNGTGNNTTAGTFFVNVSNTNDGPVLTAPTAVTVNEDSANNLVPGLSLADPDDFGAVERVTLDLGPGAKGTLTLGTITGLVFSTGDGTADGTMVFQGTKAAINAALATLSFTPTLNTNTVSTTQSLTITVDDLGNTGAGGPLTDTKTVAITITPVNDAPVRNGAGTAVLPAATEDVTGNPSATVASLFTGAFNDLLDTVSGGTTANAFAGIAITANASIPTQGVWQYSTDGTNWTDLPIVSTTSAFLLNPNDSLRFVPAANYFGTPGQLTARLIDGSGAAFTTGTRDNVSNDTTLSGGITRYSNSANAVTLATTVANVNDRPTLSATTLLTITEDTPNATTIGQIAQPSYGDALDNQSSIAGGGNATGTLGWVAITGNTTDASKGQWQYFEAGAWQTVPAAGLGDANAIVLASNTPLRFVATADYNGPVPGGLTIRVADASNATDTGVNLGTGQNLTASLNDGANSTSHWSMAGALNVLVTAVSDAANDTATTHAGVPVTTAVLTNDSFENPGAAVTAVTNGAHGSVVINGNGTVTYTPVAGYVGTDSYTYTVTSGGVTETATVNVTITNVAPVPQPDTNSVPEDTPATGNVLGNETDAETDPLQVTQFVVNGQTAAAGGSVTIAGVGTLTIAANGAYVFTPVADWHGTVPQVTYTATDGNSNGTVTSTLDIVVTPVVDIANDTIATHAGTPVVVPVLGNDGFENPGAAVTVVTAGAHGTVVINANGTVTYTPVAGYVGPDSFTYTVTSGGVTETATVIVDVTNVPPVARPDTGSVDEDGPPLVRNAATGVLASAGVPGSVDSDPDGDPIAVIGVSAGTATSVGGIPTTTVGQSVTGVYGTLVLQADGSYQYDVQNANPTVNALKTGQQLQDVFSYAISDGLGGTAFTTLTITINGNTDVASGPSIVAVDGNGAAVGEVEVHEAGLTDGPAGPDGRETATGTIVIDTADGLSTVTIGGTPLTVAQLLAITPATPVVIDTPQGTLTLTGYVVTTAQGVPTLSTLSYSYTLDGQVSQPGAIDSTEAIALQVTDAGGGISAGVLTVRIVDDVPVATIDTAVIGEDDGVGTVSSNLKTNDLNGADNANGVPVTGVASGGNVGAVGSPLATAYGSIVVNADGSYTYTLDNAHPAVQRLVAGETLTETVTYTITDADGDTSVATLTLTVQGRNDVATLQIVDGNGGDIGQATVNERGLGDSGDASETTTGRFVIGTPDGLGSVQVGGVSVTPAQLAALGGTPVVIATARGTITLTGFDAATGTLTYSYTLGGNAAHGGGEITDDIAVTVTDRDGDSTSATLRVRVVDDVPTARNDAAGLGIALPNATVGGNVFGTGGRGPGDVADRLGADVTPTPVSGFSFNGVSGVIGGAPLAGAYGTLQLRADGSYVYAVNDRQQAVAALGDGKTLTEVFSYTITDADGSTSTAQLVITIRGASPARPLTGDQIFPVDYPNENRRITQGMQPALFVQLAVRWSERLSEAASAAIATRVAGGDATYGADDIQSETLRIPQDMGNVQHVSRDGVAFSLRMLADLRQSLAMRGLGAGLPDGANALFGDFPGFTVPAAEGDGSAPSAAAAPGAERIVVPAARPHADARDAADAVDAAALGALAVPGAQASVDGARSFSQRLALAAGERGSVRDLVRMQQQREAVRVKVKQVTL